LRLLHWAIWPKLPRGRRDIEFIGAGAAAHLRCARPSDTTFEETIMNASRLLTFLAAALITVAQIVALARATTNLPPDRASFVQASAGDIGQARNG
jgi:hypothetical protein